VPALSRIENPRLRALVEELRFAPKSTLVRHIRRVEELAPLIEPQGVYPEDFIVFRVTGYRPDMESPALLGGDGVLHDLSAVCERLCESAGLQEGDDAAALVTLDELSERWGVSRKTIERWRRSGLVARRVDRGSGRRAIVFSELSVERFELAHPDRVGRASGFSRFSAREKTLAVRWARRYHASLGWGATRCATRIAQRLGRSTEGARLALVEHDRGPDPVFERRTPGSADQRAALLEQSRSGRVDPSRVGLGDRDSATITRYIDRARHERAGRALAGPLVLRGAGVKDDEIAVLEHPSVAEGLLVERPRDLASLLALMREERAQNAGEQAACASAAIVLTRRASDMFAALNPSSPSAGALDAIETDLRWVLMLRVALVRTQLTLILRSVEERLGGAVDTLDPSRASEIVLGAIAAAHAPVAAFDPSKGGRLSGRVGLALSRYAARLHDVAAPTPQGRAARRVSEVHAVDDWTGTVWEPWDWLRPIGLERVPGLADEDARALLTRRYGLDGERPSTLSELAQTHGTTQGAMRRRERAAVRALAESAQLGGSDA